MRKSSIGPLGIVGIVISSIATVGFVAGGLFISRMGGLRLPWGSGGILSFARNNVVGELVTSGWQKEEKDQSIEGAFREIEIQGISGGIVVNVGEGSAIQVHSVKTAPSQTAMQALQVDIQTRQDRLVIHEKREGFRLGNSGSISWEVSIPKGVKSIVAHTVSGSITLKNVPPGIDQRLETVSGAIDTGYAHDLHVNTTSGRVGFVFAGKSLDVHSISGAVHGSIQSIEKGGSMDIGTVSGSVSLEAYDALDAALSLKSLSGHVSCEFPGSFSQKRNNSLEGRIGGGDARITVNTISGSISIDKL
jgi:hypothetical protein